jgi:hypothetical protein
VNGKAFLAAFTIALAVVFWVEPLEPLQALLGMSALLCGILCLRP